MLTLLFDGIAYGMLLFLLASGLAVTLGLMNLVNLAHGAFAMAGGYLAVALVNRWGVPFAPALLLAFLGTALLGVVMERLLYRHVYRKSPLDQVLFSIGLVFMAMAVVDYTQGSQQQFVNVPAALQGRFALFGASIGIYRLLIIGVCGVIALALQLVLTAHALRRAAPRRGRRSARRARARHRGEPRLRGDLRGRIRPGRARRRARRGDPRARSGVSAEIPDLLPDRRDRRRHCDDQRPVPRRAAARHRRRRRQILPARLRRLRDLHA